MVQIIHSTELTVCHIDEILSSEKLTQVIYIAAVDGIVSPVPAQDLVTQRYGSIGGYTQTKHQLPQIRPVVLIYSTCNLRLFIMRKARRKKRLRPCSEARASRLLATRSSFKTSFSDSFKPRADASNGPDMKNQEEKLREQLKILRAEQRSLIRLLLRKDELAIGTLYKVNKRCGSPYCHCRKGEGHPHTFFMFSEKGKRRCKFVRQADVQRMRKAAERYKKCRDALRRLKSIHLQEIKILTDLISKRGIVYQ